MKCYGEMHKTRVFINPGKLLREGEGWGGENWTIVHKSSYKSVVETRRCRRVNNIEISCLLKLPITYYSDRIVIENPQRRAT